MGARKLSAGVVVVRQEGGVWRFLMLRAYNYWDFPKGVVEDGEEPLDAARREADEEAGIRHLDFRWGETWRETPPYCRGKVARYYVAETPQRHVMLRVNPELGRPEHQEARWVTVEQARALVTPRLAVILAWASGVIGEVG